MFNFIGVDEGKVYHSYYGSYMNIRNQSDKLSWEQKRIKGVVKHIQICISKKRALSRLSQKSE
ncbi:hypothetical protein [Granulicatella elegans]|uniref:hypothetical protein n=1 Tax=Granulicatella elegans TaxID=137732 RepID=UPI002ACE7DBB|nr:hypothetical protein [Granulicatella elegans]